MADKRQRLQYAVDALQARYSVRAAQRGAEWVRAPRVGAISTGFRSLDAITGYAGLPLNAITLLSGPPTSGKHTLAYLCLRQAQVATPRQPLVALIDLPGAADPDYIARCGVELADLLIVRPPTPEAALGALADVLRARQTRAILADGLLDGGAGLPARLATLASLMQNSRCALLLLDTPRPGWREWLNAPGRGAAIQQAALHLEARRERWLDYEHSLRGYRAQIRVARSRRGQAGASAAIEIVFNGVVRRRETW
ncbi:MAG: DNA recombination/repair protein RecA [Thermoflexales bacterium]|nr:DNA recombination/repair protein RecA [Thermoflexales bacterium]